MNGMMKIILGRHGVCGCVALLLAFLLSSCNNSDYVKNIPSGCSALLAVDPKKVEGADGNAMLKALLPIDDIQSTGIDFGSKIYFFETADGNLGIAAKIKSEDDFSASIAGLAAKGKSTKVKERGDLSFALVNGSWLVAFSGNAMMTIGPITAASRPEVERTVMGYFSQDEEQSIVKTKIYEHIDTMASPISLVAQAQALPEKFVAPFTIGAPKEADASQVMIAARLSVEGKSLVIDGTTYSDNNSVDKALREANAVFRPITPKLVSSYNSRNILGLFMNVDGKAFLPLLQQNKGIQALLVGLNTAIDMDNILRSVDGDLVITVPSYSGDGNMALSLTAKLGNKAWLGDVDYWKQSCPNGTTIANAGVDTFCYSDGKMKFFFGVSPDLYFFSGNDKDAAAATFQTSRSPLTKSVLSELVGKRMAMVLNLRAVAESAGGAAETFINSFVGSVENVVYVRK